MSKGRKPKPAALRILEGNPGKRPINNAVKPDIQPLEPPAFLRSDGLYEWNRLHDHLVEIGVLTVLDRSIFSAYCSAYNDYCEAERLLEDGEADDRFVNEGKDGELTRNIISRARNEAAAAMVKYATELGMTPSSRSKVTPAPKPGKPNKFAALKKAMAQGSE